MKIVRRRFLRLPAAAVTSSALLRTVQQHPEV
jgi:hypothetical protein